MKLVPWRSEVGSNVFDDLESFQKEMNRLFDVTVQRPLKLGNGEKLWMPAVDIVDEKNQIKVKVDLPGLKKEDIEVNVEHNVLTIKGEKKEEKESKEKDYIRSERYYGAFHRAFTLPDSVDATKVNATYKEGVLDVTLPKKDEVKAIQNKVEVK